MIPINKLLLVFVAICGFCLAPFGSIAASGTSELDKALDSAYAKVTDVEITENRDFESFVPYIHHIGFSEGQPGIASIVRLWKNGHRQPVELAWWRSEHRSVRLLVLGLFYGQFHDRDISIFPQFDKYTSRFEDNERKLREEEIEYVDSHIVEIREKLSRFFVE